MWQKSKDFAVKVYSVTKDFPKEEAYGLVSQLRRASVSIASNIAEGFQRRSPAEKKQFLRIALGSGAEAQTQIIISEELGYLSGPVAGDLQRELEEIMKIINAVLNKLQ